MAADYHLAQGWSKYAEGLDVGTLAEHSEYVDHILADRRSQLPEGLKRFAEVLRKQQLLVSWSTKAGVEQTLQRLSRRSERFAPLAECIEQLWLLEEEVSGFVDELWPALLTSTRQMHRRMGSL